MFRKRIKKGVALLFVLCFTLTVQAKQSQMKLPTKMVVKAQKEGKWKMDFTLYFKYNQKGDLTRIDMKTPEMGIDEWIPSVIRYQYKNGVKKSAVATDSYGKYTYKFNNKGHIKSVKLELDDGNVRTWKYTYDKREYIKSRDWTLTEKFFPAPSGSDSYNTYINDGKLSSITIIGFDWGWGSTAQILKYNSKGLLKSDRRFDDKGNMVIGYSYSYEYDGDYVKYRYDKRLQSTDKFRRQYTYGSVKGSLEEYLMILNLDYRALIGNTERLSM